MVNGEKDISRRRLNGRSGRSRVAAIALLLLSWLLLIAVKPALAIDDGITDYLTIPAGSYIINMGITPQTVANSMKPYGLVYALIRNNGVPVLWVINPAKAKDGVDFTDPNSGKSYRGGPFIIEAPHVSAAALSTINNWKAQGVQVDGPTTGSIPNVPVYDSLSGLGTAVLDLDNGSIAAQYFTAAGIPTSTFRLASPSNLNTCDDYFAMPHADPTWTTHRYLIDFVKQRGYIWSGCHAVSVLENIDDPSTPAVNPDMNFLSRTGLVPFGSHADGSPPYTTSLPSSPVMQYMGTTDAAQLGGSEQIYLPKLSGGWRPGANVVVYDPTQQNVPALSPGPAAAIVYGRAYDVSFYGQVMYEGGHDISGNAAANIAAQRAFMNFWLLSMLDRSPDVTISGSASVVNEGGVITLNSNVTSPYGVTYQWISPQGGTFGSPNAATTTFTPPEVSTDTTFYIQLRVVDTCSRTGYDLLSVTVANLPKADLAIVKTDSADPVSVNGAFSYALAVSNLGTEPATTVKVEDVLPAGLTYVSASGSGWTCGYDAGTRKVTCTRATLALTGGTPSVITINVTAPAATGTVSNTATVSSSLPDINPANNTASQNTTVLQGIDVAVTKTAPAGPFASGRSFSYTLNVQNISALTATSLTVKDVLPAALTFVAASGSGWNCVYSGPDRTVTCFLPSLAASGTSAITLTVTPSGTAGDSIVNTATLTSPDFVDQNQANNTSTATITLAASADLALTKTGSTTGGGGNDQTDTWIVTLTNNGPGTATGIVVSDTFSGSHVNRYQVDHPDAGTPPYGCIVSPSTGAISPNPYYNIPADPDTSGISGYYWPYSATPSPNISGTWSIASLASGASATLTFTCYGDNQNGVTNSATVTASSYDPNTSNNQASAFVLDGTIKNGDIQITKTDSPDPVFVSGTVTYRITLNNLGTEDANNTHTVVDTLPTGATYAGYVTATTDNPGGKWICPATTPAIVGPATVTCTTNSDLKKLTGSPNKLYFDLLVTAPAIAGAITNTVTTSYAWPGRTYDPPANNTATATTQVIHRSTDIAVTKTVNNATPLLHANVTFTVTATNSGPNPASNLRLTDLLPAGLTYQASVPAVPSQGSYDPATGIWYVGSLAVGAGATLTITASANASATNTACYYTMDQSDTNSANNCASVAVTPQYADLVLTKTVDNATPNVNSNAVFTVTLHNNGPTAASAIAVQDLLPEGLAVQSAVPSTGSYTPATGLWSVPGPLASGANATLVITAKVTAPETAFTNTASITASSLPDNNTGNNSASVTVTGKQADIAVQKTVDNSTPLALNTPLTFTITVWNNGPSAATGVEVNDLLPAGLSYQSHTASQGTYNSGTGLWTIGSLAPASGSPPAPAATLTLVATNTVFGTLINEAAKTHVDQYDPDPTNDVSRPPVSILSGGSANLEITKSVDKPDTYRGQTATFTLVLHNLGTSPATGVKVTDLLPAGLSYQSHSTSQGTYNSGTGVWDVGNIAVNQRIILTLSVLTNADGTFTNLASVTALNQADPDTTNNTSSAVVTVRPMADLTITKTGPTSVNLAAPVTYTLIVTENGPSDVSGFSIVDTVPAQITAVSWTCVATGNADCDTTTGGTAAAGSGNAITLNHASITVGTGNALTITVNGTASATGTFTNTAIVSPPSDNSVYDKYTENNSASVTTVVSNIIVAGRVFADTGTGGGIPNDGILNGGEAGIARVTVSLTNCSSTPYATTTTDGAGNYILAISSTIAAGTTLCVVQANLNGYLSTGGQVGNTGGAYDRATDRVQFVLAANTNYTSVNFGDVPENRFLTDGAKTALPGTTVSYPHTFVAGTGGQVSFSTFAAASPSIVGWVEVLYRDVTCDGMLTAPADQQITGPVTVTEGERVCVILQEFVPGNAPPGATNLATVQAAFVYTNASPALSATYTHQDLTNVSDVALQLTKEVRNITRGGPWTTSNTAKQGEELEYRITYLNSGVNPISSLVVHDSTPAFTVYVSAQCGTPLPVNLTSCTVTTQPSIGSPGSIKWTFSGYLAPSVSGTVVYRVRLE